MFKLSQKPFNISDFYKGLDNPAAGALSVFQGIVRDHNDGKRVVALEYEAHAELAEKEAEKIFEEAESQFKTIAIRCWHRVGKLKVGDIAVLVGVTAGHRDDAFQACRYIIDEIKKRLPIWKKEYYTHGHSGWVNCERSAHEKHAKTSPVQDHHCAHLSFAQQEFYSRQMILPEIGQDGQNILKKSRVLVVGAGGLGSPALLYLAAAGVGTIGICEFDALDPTNLHRQILYRHQDVGGKKIDLARQHLLAFNPFIQVISHAEKISAQNAAAIIAQYDVVVDCSDNFETKFLLNDIAYLKKIPLVQASIYQFEGQLRVYHPSTPAACLRCLWTDVSADHCVGSCTDVGVLGVVPGILGALQALETIKLILDFPQQLKEETLIFDLKEYHLHRIRQKKNPACPLCGSSPTLTTIQPGTKKASENIDLEINNLSIKDFRTYQLVDIREPKECVNTPVKSKSCLHLPMSQIDQKRNSFRKDKKYLLFCGRGMRSHRLAKDLRNSGIPQVFSVLRGAPAVKKYLTQRKS